ncbi:cache domain-containing protein [Prosthecochloris sp. N3]|uniref:Cache domain-containing protein n=1 Tax=Prosthecochloris ethylica TaxID=2743976 RepID=A0ABR9XTA1_9CHLB|nr:MULTISPECIES: cache domain-containing protein [Prosthecochloris]MBF0585950.1 cache domain-containing protein [Prosthecochloris ethylica]MBF0637045.1 cache domain-containing protein [Prosthecochloris ethylica]NUK47282.1 cache domain-containing protein [Prosthecochloris ethylica]RNA64077.1 calcium:proton antiporter [Prosthecochloris sp. ZM_2]
MFRRPAFLSDLVRLLCFFAWLLLGACESRYDDLDLSVYDYRDTRNLVRFVHDAARVLEREGLSGLEEFRTDKRYRSPDRYLYVYDMQANNLYHAGMPSLEGKNLYEVTDINGKKVSQLILQALDDPGNRHAWVHYTWWAPGSFYPVPKSSCHARVTTPEGVEVYVGAGMDFPHEEKEFVRIVVDGAVRLIETSGEQALAELADPRSCWNYRDVRVFAFFRDGRLLISPVVQDSLLQLQLFECRDEVGHKPFASAVNRLDTRERVWEVFMVRSRYQRTPVKKCLYLCRTSLGGQDLFVGAITDLPQPP